MISDTLFEARLEIERYLREMPNVYETMQSELHALCAEMYRLQMTLDHPYGHPPVLPYYPIPVD